MLRIQKSLSIILFLDSIRILSVQQYVNHLKNQGIVDHFFRKKTRRKPRSCRRFVSSQGWWRTVRDTLDDNNRFYETFSMSYTRFYYILNKISDQIEKNWCQEYQFLQPPDLL